MFRVTCLLASLLAITFDLIEASPIFPKPTSSAEFQILQGSGPDHESPSKTTASRRSVCHLTARSSVPAENEHNKGKNVAAIVGGTIATGIILVILVFVLFAIRRQWTIRRALKEKKNDLGKSPAADVAMSNIASSKKQKKASRPSNHFPRTSPLPPPRTSPRPFPEHCQGQEGSDFDIESIYSHDPGSANSVTAVVGTRGYWDGPVPEKAAHFLGLHDREDLEFQPSSPRSPIAPAGKSERPQKSCSQSSECTMSTLGVELLRDTMTSPAPEKFSPPSSGKPWQLRHATEQSQATNDVQAERSRLPSQVCFLPTFSPTSPSSQGVDQPPYSGRKSIDGKNAEKIVRRVTERGKMFGMGENKF